MLAVARDLRLTPGGAGAVASSQFSVMRSMGASRVITASPDGYLAQIIMVRGYDTP